MKVTFVFPGQGAQRPGMGAALSEAYPPARAVFDCLGDTLGRELVDLVFNGPEGELTRTVNAQPAMLAVSVAAGRVARSLGLEPAAAAGLSVGEYAALVMAGSLTLPDAFRLVRLRGELMEASCPRGLGGMTAVVGLPAAEVARLCREEHGQGVVEVANHNAPDQTVISGEREALDRVASRCAEAGAKRVIPLAVSAPFHTSLLKPAGEGLAKALAQVSIADPQLPVVANVTAGYVSTADQVRANLAAQVSSPVRWCESVERLWADGHRVFVELGPGKTVSGLVKRIVPDAVAAGAEDPPSFQKLLDSLGVVC